MKLYLIIEPSFPPRIITKKQLSDYAKPRLAKRQTIEDWVSKQKVFQVFCKADLIDLRNSGIIEEGHVLGLLEELNGYLYKDKY